MAYSVMPEGRGADRKSDESSGIGSQRWHRWSESASMMLARQPCEERRRRRAGRGEQLNTEQARIYAPSLTSPPARGRHLLNSPGAVTFSSASPGTPHRQHPR